MAFRTTSKPHSCVSFFSHLFNSSLIHPLYREDITNILNQKFYFPSYNIPYFEDIFNISGYRDAGFSYDNDPRAKMFRAYSPSIQSFDDFKFFMNSNDYQHDVYSQGSACNAISARCDLLSSGNPISSTISMNDNKS